MPRPHITLAAHVRSMLMRRTSLHARFALLFCLLIAFVMPPAPTLAAPHLSLPTPEGETWKIIQGYGCGTHNSWDRYSLDLANASGRTKGAPARAAADGKVWAWVASSGTLILSHGDNFYTMYTHMSSAVSTRRGQFFARGATVGTVGDRQANGTPHLHFTAFTAKGSRASGRQSVQLSFSDGYDLPEIGGCNQYGGKKMVAGGEE